MVLTKEFYMAADKMDRIMMKACLRCEVAWEECPATSDCPVLQDLLAHPETGCSPITGKED